MITSKSNPRIKSLIRLQKSNERRKQQRTLIEGYREIERALISGWKPETLFVSAEIAGTRMEQLIRLLPDECETVFLSREVFEHIAYREGSDGILAVCEPIQLSLDEIQTGLNPLIIVLESVEKPGNMGAILRTADAVSADAVIVCEPGTDLYNPNTIRASLGCIFSVPFTSCSSEEALRWLRSKQCRIYATTPESSTDYLDMDFTGPTALVMGSEATGLTDFWIKNADKHIRIEMEGIADSLNVSVATAVIAFESKRQKKVKNI
ncbi:MAG: RNA methyltransferase [Bacteroidales bacterium]